MTDAALIEVALAQSRLDAARAVEWAPPRLAGIKDPLLRARALAALGRAVATVRPDVAAQLLREAGALVPRQDFSAAATRAISSWPCCPCG